MVVGVNKPEEVGISAGVRLSIGILLASSLSSGGKR